MNPVAAAAPAAHDQRPAGRSARPVVSCRGVAKLFSNGTLALQNVDLDIGRHQFVSLLGPSGCGKSTLLRLIAGLGEPSAGMIDWPADREGADHALSFVFQEPTLMPWAPAILSGSIAFLIAVAQGISVGSWNTKESA